MGGSVGTGSTGNFPIPHNLQIGIPILRENVRKLLQFHSSFVAAMATPPQVSPQVVEGYGDIGDENDKSERLIIRQLKKNLVKGVTGTIGKLSIFLSQIPADTTSSYQQFSRGRRPKPKHLCAHLCRFL
jgi:hypothetical protein